MGIGGIWQWVVVLVIVLVLFGGRGKISQLMGDFGKGLKSFKKGIKEDGPEPVEAKNTCLLYTSPSPRDRTRSRMPSSA